MTPAELVAVREHLTACDACRVVAATDEAVAAALDTLPVVTAAPGFVARVMARVRAEAPARVQRARWIWAAPLAAALLGAAGLTWYVDRGARRDREVIAELDTLEQIELLGTDLAMDNSLDALELLSRGGALPAVLVPAEDEGN
jgi:hypothetical protein